MGLLEAGAALDRVRGADDLGVTVVAIEVVSGAPLQRTVRIGERVTSYGDPEVGCVEFDQLPDQSSLAPGNCAEAAGVRPVFLRVPDGAFGGYF